MYTRSTLGGQNGGNPLAALPAILSSVASGIGIAKGVKPIGRLNRLRKRKNVKLPGFLNSALNAIEKAGFGSKSGGKTIGINGGRKRRVGRPRKVGRPKKH